MARPAELGQCFRPLGGRAAKEGEEVVSVFLQDRPLCICGFPAWAAVRFPGHDLATAQPREHRANQEPAAQASAGRASRRRISGGAGKTITSWLMPVADTAM